MKQGVAPPRPRPAMNRYAISIGKESASTVTQVKRPKSAVVNTSSGLRPKRSESGPNRSAPTAAPSKPDEYAGENAAGVIFKSAAISGPAKLIVVLSTASNSATKAQKTKMRYCSAEIGAS